MVILLTKNQELWQYTPIIHSSGNGFGRLPCTCQVSCWFLDVGWWILHAGPRPRRCRLGVTREAPTWKTDGIIGRCTLCLGKKRWIFLSNTFFLNESFCIVIFHCWEAPCLILSFLWQPFGLFPGDSGVLINPITASLYIHLSS